MSLYRHLQRRHGAPDIEHPPRRHRGLHVHRPQRRGADIPHRQGDNSRGRRHHGAPDEPDQARGREGPVQLRGESSARERDRQVVSGGRASQGSRLPRDQSYHPEGRVAGHKSC